MFKMFDKEMMFKIQIMISLNNDEVCEWSYHTLKHKSVEWEAQQALKF